MPLLVHVIMSAYKRVYVLCIIMILSKGSHKKNNPFQSFCLLSVSKNITAIIWVYIIKRDFENV